MNANFIFAVSVEDFPYRAQLDVEGQWRAKFPDLLREVGLCCDKNCMIHASSRHIVVAARLPEYAETKECVGPPPTMPERVIESFAKRRNLQNYQIRDTSKGKRWCGDLPGAHASELLPEVLNKLFDATSFDYVMQSHGWIRPVRGFVCTYNGKSVDFSLRRVGVATQDSLVGFPDGKEVRFDGSADPIKVLAGHGLLADFADKLEKFKSQISLDGIDSSYTDLLYENLRTVPNPIAVKCRVPEEFMHFPRELLVLPMTVHQKLVPSTNNCEFVAIANSGVDCGIVRRNIERVMCSRLQDVQEFYNCDTSKTLEQHLGRLHQRTVFDGLGTYADRRARVCKVAEEISDNNTLRNAAKLVYFDLFTAMVEEFPEVEGRIGRIYLTDAYNREVGDAVRVGQVLENALWPRREDDPLPDNFDQDSALLSWIKRLDALVGFAILDKLPSGSKDPMCLRREAMGFARIGFEAQPTVPWKKIALRIVELYNINCDASAVVARLETFINQRILYLLRTDPQHTDIAQDVLRGRASVWSARERCVAGQVHHKLVMALQSRVRNLGIAPKPYVKKFGAEVECNLVRDVDNNPQVAKMLSDVMQKIALYNQRESWSERLLVLNDACAAANYMLDSVHIKTSAYRERIVELLGMLLDASETYAMVES